MPLESLPGPDEPVVHLHRQGDQIGPMTRRELHRRVRVGEASTDDHFWLPGMDGWEPIGTVAELFRDLEAPEPDTAPSPGAGTVMIPRSALGDLVQEEEASAEAAGTMMIDRSTLDAAGQAGPSTGVSGGGAAQIGAATVRFAPGTDMAALLQQSGGSPAEAEAEATREEDRSGAGSEDAEDPGDDTSPVGTLSEAMAEPADAPKADSAAVDDDALDAVFADLVESSWAVLEETTFAQHVDEVFLGALITGALDVGWSLIDLESDGTHHFLRFENLDDGTRLVFRLRHLTGDLAKARVLGQKASVVIGYGQKAPNAKDIVSAVRDELKGGFMKSPEPGTITVDGDLTSGYVYAQVDLTLSIDRYVAEDYAIDHALLAEHVHATVHALRKYLRGRFFS